MCDLINLLLSYFSFMDKFLEEYKTDIKPVYTETDLSWLINILEKEMAVQDGMLSKENYIGMIYLFHSIFWMNAVKCGGIVLRYIVSQWQW